jgi:hypothetical protein
MNQVTTQSTFSLTPQNVAEAMQLAELMANSEMVPKDFKGKPGNVLVAVQMGADVGLPPMQAIQNIAVINGRPALWGDAVKAVVLGSPLCLKFEERFDEPTMTAYVTVQRKGHAEVTVTFSQADAEKASLWAKSGPWTQYPKRMLQMRARGFAARDEFADVLKGLSVAEELQDYSEREVNPTPPAATKNINEATGEILQPEYPQAHFDKNYPKWNKLIQEGKKTHDAIISMVTSKYSLNEEQIEMIKSIPVGE